MAKVCRWLVLSQWLLAMNQHDAGVPLVANTFFAFLGILFIAREPRNLISYTSLLSAFAKKGRIRPGNFEHLTAQLCCLEGWPWFSSAGQHPMTFVTFTAAIFAQLWIHWTSHSISQHLRCDSLCWNLEVCTECTGIVWSCLISKPKGCKRLRLFSLIARDTPDTPNKWEFAFRIWRLHPTPGLLSTQGWHFTYCDQVVPRLIVQLGAAKDRLNLEACLWIFVAAWVPMARYPLNNFAPASAIPSMLTRSRKLVGGFNQLPSTYIKISCWVILGHHPKYLGKITKDATPSVITLFQSYPNLPSVDEINWCVIPPRSWRHGRCWFS